MIMTFLSHLFTCVHEREHQAQDQQAKQQHGGNPNSEVQSTNSFVGMAAQVTVTCSVDCVKKCNGHAEKWTKL